MKKTNSRSLNFYMAFFLGVLTVLLTITVVYNNYTAFSLLKKNIYANTLDTLVLYQKNLDKNLTQTETYLRSKLIDNSRNLNTLRTASLNQTDWFSAQYQLTQNFSAALPTYTTNCFFCYLPKKNQYIQCNNTDASTAAALKKTISELICSGEVEYNSWMLLSVKADYYFVYTLNYYGTCIGSWCSTKDLLDTVSNGSHLYFSTPEGKLLRNQYTPLSLTPPEESSPYLYEKIDGEKVLSVSHPLKTAPFYLTTLVPESELSGKYQNLINVVIIVTACFLLIWFIIFIFLRKFIHKPIYALIGAITQLSEGNLNACVPIGRQPDEFRHLSQAFNEMVCEIKGLKIDVYERQIQRQRLEMQYLKQQITPHFMINCLNTVYQLTETNHSDLARKMLRDLSIHLRYTLSSGQTVSLSEELELTQNYIELSSIRYPGSITYFQECPKELGIATAIPLLILNFVENTIKYEVTMGKLLEIHVEVSSRIQDSRTLLDICVWDTGNGFDEVFLQRLQDVDNYAEHENYHIGIVNTYLRAKHIFETHEFSFCNREGAGAQINMTIPCIPFNSVDPIARSEGGLS